MRPHSRNPTALKAGNDFSFSSGNPTPSSNERADHRGISLPVLSQPPLPLQPPHYPKSMPGRNFGPTGSGSNPRGPRHELYHQSQSDSTRRQNEMGTTIQGRPVPILKSLKTKEERILLENAQHQERIENAKLARNERKLAKQKANQALFNDRSTSNSSTNEGNEPTSFTSHIANSPGSPGRSSSSSSNGGSGSGDGSSSSSYQCSRRSPSPPGGPSWPPPLGQAQRSIFMNDWRSRPEVKVRLAGLPLQFTTWDVYERFQEFGTIDGIKLYENTHGTRDGGGEVTFSHVNYPFWEKPVQYMWKYTTQVINATLLPLPRHKYKVISGVSKGVEYPDRFIFKPKELDFGLMIQESVFMPMHTVVNNADDIVFEVNLYRKHIDVKFKVYHTKGYVPAASDTPSEHEEPFEKKTGGSAAPAKERWECYRFQIPFAQLTRILEFGPRISGGRRAFLISLPTPPVFWREVFDVAKTHVLGANYWSGFDKWFRQTGIAFDQIERSNSPVCLRQKNPMIDTGRWTTYRLQFGLEKDQIGRFEKMISALGDFNIRTEMFDGLEITTEKPIPIWDTIDATSTNSFRDDLLAAMRPLLPYPTRYQLEVCISRNYLNEYNMTTEFIDHLLLIGPERAVCLLEHVAENEKRRFYNPMDIFSLVPRGGTAALLKKLENKKGLEGDFQRVRKASITPSTVYYATPVVETTNRVIRHYRHYSDKFLRVQFVDEFKGRINSTDRDVMNEVFTRIMTALTYGITIGGEHFEFLAFGNSQIREHGAYFFASNKQVSVKDIREWMGKFSSIRVVAKHAARLGQCFSTTHAIRGVQVDVVGIPDIEYPDNEYNFSDGVGKISEFLARLISMELKPSKDGIPPSCFQFRLGGCKGVLTVWPDVKQREVCIRPSQEKFKAKHKILEVIRCSKPASACLNRQLIIVLSSLGASDDVFKAKLVDTLKKFADAMVSPGAAQYLLCRAIDANQFTLTLASLVRGGFMVAQEPFVISLLNLWRSWSIKYLKEKARIMVEKGAFVLGVVDETGILEGHYDEDEDVDKGDGYGDDNEAKKGPTPPILPEIFLQISDPENEGQFRVIQGLCLVARNPSLHPGDIRTVRAIDVPELRHLRNVVVFPSKGDRDLASMLSGGDLDGDDYIVIWDEDLTNGVTNYPPMDYSPLLPKVLEEDVQIHDITKFFVNYMKNDKLGAIANSHLAWADYLDEGVKSVNCLQLAALHSDAVDYVKTGVPAKMHRNLRIQKYPHFMEKEKEKTYISRKVLGQLYDMVDKIDFIPSYELQFDERILNAYTLDESDLLAARELKSEYDAALRGIMAQHEIHTEFEVYSTFVLHHSQASGDYKYHEEIASIRDCLRQVWRKVVEHEVGSSDELDLGPFVVAMYTVTKQELDAALEDLRAKKARGRKRDRPVEGAPLRFTPEDVKAMPLISFPWLFQEILGKIANRDYPFRKSDDSFDESLGQNEFDSEIRRHASTSDTQAGVNHQPDTALDPTGFETIPVEEIDSSYIYFDYKEQSDEGETKEHYDSHASDSEGSESSGILQMFDDICSPDGNINNEALEKISLDEVPY